MISLASLFGCKKQPEVQKEVFDYGLQKENFIVEMKINQPYTIIKDSERFDFIYETKKVDNNVEIHLTYRLIEKTVTYLNRYEYRVFLIRKDNNDYLYLYRFDRENESKGYLNYLVLSDKKYTLGDDNASIRFISPIDNPDCFKAVTAADCLGHVEAEMSYYAGLRGKPTLIEGQKYYYCLNEYTTQKYVSDQDSEVMIFDNKDSEDGQIGILPQGSVFTRLRSTVDENYSDLLLEDGRVFRIIENYLFSEPEAYMQLLDFKGEQFQFSELN